MRYEFSETIRLPTPTVFEYFRSPEGWMRLYGDGEHAQALGDGWYSVPLARSPAPLVVQVEPSADRATIEWVFRGFWRGAGRLTLTAVAGGTQLDGYEEIAIRWLGPLSWVVERLVLAKVFHGIWNRGWRRLLRLSSGGRLRASPLPGDGSVNTGKSSTGLRQDVQEEALNPKHPVRGV